MTTRRNAFIRRAVLCIAVLAAAATPRSAQALDYPVRPIQVIVPLAAGGPGDILMRVVADKMGELLGQRVIIENRPGAGSNVGFGAAARSTPDGYTLLLGLAPLTINPSLFKSVPYDPIKDFVPISRIATFPLVITTHPSIPAKTLPELIAYIRSKPGEMNYGSSGLGSTPHLAGVLMDKVAQTKMVHVPYNGVPAAMTDLITNRIQIVFAGPPIALPFLKEGKIKAFAVASPERSATVPDVPTTVEAGLPGFEIATWYGLLAPAGTPSEIVEKLHATLGQVLGDPAIKQRLLDLGADAAFDARPSLFADYIARDIPYWRELVQSSGARID
ncbi:tripartite tricarboxylate transporter substrate binding protein [Afipia sp. P52-10]|uniref:Bug family tripartite tricarboxylate transporter substrate binding protein n=1 Tax=Afipia sp. P52-10 TaxID=1429916 RepID=UPI0004B120E4|nr:tripartite tricarboxylate transporter substrate binding protein [Afipia sp. P52-10]